MSSVLCLVHKVDRDGRCMRCHKHISEFAPGSQAAPIIEGDPSAEQATAAMIVNLMTATGTLQLFGTSLSKDQLRELTKFSEDFDNVLRDHIVMSEGK